jgi:hypothetical protein
MVEGPDVPQKRFAQRAQSPFGFFFSPSRMTDRFEYPMTSGILFARWGL